MGVLEGAELETAEVLWEGRFQNTFGSWWTTSSAKADRRSGIYDSDADYLLVDRDWSEKTWTSRAILAFHCISWLTMNGVLALSIA